MAPEREIMLNSTQTEKHKSKQEDVRAQTLTLSGWEWELLSLGQLGSIHRLFTAHRL